MSDERAEFLRRLPPVNAVIAQPEVARLAAEQGHAAIVGLVREELEWMRDGDPFADSREAILERLAELVVQRVRERELAKLDRVVNATGVVLHTGLGRAPLSQRALEAVGAAAGSCNLELELGEGNRSYRGGQLLESWRTLTQCEDAFVVNNNAAATLLVLAAHCSGSSEKTARREVIVSRGQLVEIGGSFRLPEIFELGGAVLREVGTTNRTRVSDYESAVGPHTAAILRVHPSNYRIDGFSEMPDIEELVPIARAHGLLCIDDIGSGCLVDTTTLGLPAEPTFQRSLAAGADLVLGSGDKLLGGPQAGIVLGTKQAVDPLRRHPFARTVRIDKLTLAALGGTLDGYLAGAEFEELPVLRLLGEPIANLEVRAERIRERVSPVLGDAWTISTERTAAMVGGGSLPGSRLPTVVVALTSADDGAEAIARRLRTGSPRLLPRVHDGRVLVDLRSILAEDDDAVVDAVNALGSRS